MGDRFMGGNNFVIVLVGRVMTVTSPDPLKAHDRSSKPTFTGCLFFIAINLLAISLPQPATAAAAGPSNDQCYSDVCIDNENALQAAHLTPKHLSNFS